LYINLTFVHITEGEKTGQRGEVTFSFIKPGGRGGGGNDPILSTPLTCFIYSAAGGRFRTGNEQKVPREGELGKKRDLQNLRYLRERLMSYGKLRVRNGKNRTNRLQSRPVKGRVTEKKGKHGKLAGGFKEINFLLKEYFKHFSRHPTINESCSGPWGEK